MQNVKVDRNRYIGGSDISVILGISPFKSRFDLLLEKAGLREETFEGNKYTEYGNVMEEKIRNYINRNSINKFKEDKKIIGDIRCHVDGFNGYEVLEIKTTSQIHEKLDDYKVYLVQLLFYMEHLQVKKGCLAIYERPKDFSEEFDYKKLTTYYIDIDNYKELLKEINKAVDQFRLDLAKIKENPFLAEEDLMPTDLVELSNEVVSLENQLVEMKAIETKSKELKAQLKSAMESKGIKKWETPNGIKVTLVEDGDDKEILKFNEEKFKEENEKLYNNYLESVMQKGKLGFVKITLPKKEG